jgi:hypothetical protein
MGYSNQWLGCVVVILFLLVTTLGTATVADAIDWTANAPTTAEIVVAGVQISDSSVWIRSLDGSVYRGCTDEVLPALIFAQAEDTFRITSRPSARFGPGVNDILEAEQLSCRLPSPAFTESNGDRKVSYTGLFVGLILVAVGLFGLYLRSAD